MAHFAKIENSIVTQVIVADIDYINTLPKSDTWIQTSYNTHGGVHTLGGTPLRKNYACIGFTYDAQKDAFIPPKPRYESWILNEDTCHWKAPVAYPDDGENYIWNETTTSWDLVVPDVN